MKTKIILSISLLLSLACSLSGPAPTQEPVSVPDTEVPATRVPLTPTSEPTALPAFFRDDFNQVLAGGWSWQNEEPANWSLNAKMGWLKIDVLPGHIVTGDYSNLLLRPSFDGDFQIETSLEFVPVANFQIAGLIVYESDSDFLQAGRAFCQGADNCIGDGLYFDTYTSGTFQGPNYATPYEEGSLVHLRLQRRGDVYTYFASADGINWTEIGQHQSDLEPLRVGLVAAQNSDGVPLPARFDYFMLTELR
jgi:beta-xylosidase